MLILLGVVLGVILALVIANTLGINKKNKSNGDYTSSNVYKATDRKGSEEAGHSESNNDLSSKSTGNDGQANSNKLQVSEINHDLSTNQLALKAAIYYAIMHGSQEDVWGGYSSMISDPNNYPPLNVRQNEMATGITVTSSAAGGANVKAPTILWDWGEKVQNRDNPSQPDLDISKANGTYGVTFQDIVNYVNDHGGKATLDQLKINWIS